MMKKLFLVMLCAMLTASLFAKGSSEENTSSKSDEIEITVMHNRPDPTEAMHVYYEQVKERYEEKYPNVKVNFEIYDNETYKKKQQIYGSARNMPDVFFLWSNPSEFLPYVNADLVKELNPADYSDYEFLPNALEGSKVDGKLMGLPIGIDYWYLYVNKKIFEDNGIKIPTTMAEFETAIKELNSVGIAPVSINGKELWNQAVLFNDILLRYSDGMPKMIWDATSQITKFATTERFVEAANQYRHLVDIGMFQTSWTSDDEVTSKNLFVQGKAAMIYTGTWNNAVFTADTMPQEIRDNITIIPFPSANDYDSHRDLMGREGNTMVVSKSTDYPVEAENFLKEFFDPNYFPRISWEDGIGIPMQEFSKYVTEDSPELYKDVAASINSQNLVSSHPFAFRLTPMFEQDSKDAIMEFLLHQIDVNEFWNKIDASAAENQIK